jgi:hypothetical protein
MSYTYEYSNYDACEPNAQPLPSNVELLPSLCFAVPHHVEPDGKQIYLASDKSLRCSHGEKSSTICFWMAEEKAKRAKGLEPGPRGGNRAASVCTCQTTEGLNGAPHSDVEPPTLPSSLFAFLEDQHAEVVCVKGREARRVPHLSGPTFVTTMGLLVCRHGHSRKSLTEKSKVAAPSSRRPTCDCMLPPLPARSGRLGGIQLGLYQKKRKRATTGETDETTEDPLSASSSST